MTRSRKIVVLAAVASLTLISAAPPHHLAPCLNSQFKGITQTQADGTIIGDPDPQDWGCVQSHGVGPGRAGAAPARVRTATTEGGVPVPLPTAVCLEPAAPNPAEFGTRLQFSLPEAGHVSLIVKHARRPGHETDDGIVRTIMDTQVMAGVFAVYWDLTDDNGVPLEPGIYRAILVIGDQALCGDIEIQ